MFDGIHLLFNKYNLSGQKSSVDKINRLKGQPLGCSWQPMLARTQFVPTTALYLHPLVLDSVMICYLPTPTDGTVNNLFLPEPM